VSSFERDEFERDGLRGVIWNKGQWNEWYIETW